MQPKLQELPEQTYSELLITPLGVMNIHYQKTTVVERACQTPPNYCMLENWLEETLTT